MAVESIGRRHFLRGLGGCLVAVPFLESMATRAKAQATGEELRFVSVRSIYGQVPQLYYPARPTDRVGEHVHHRPFEAGSPISPIVGDSFAPVAHKLSMLRGLDCSYGGHNHCTMLAPSAYDADTEGDPQLQTSMDEMLGRSSLYTTSPVMRVLRLAPNRGGFGYSWHAGQRQPYEEDMPALFDKMFKGLGDGADDSGALRKLKAVDIARSSYNDLRQSGRLSGADRTRLSDYLDLLSDLENTVAAAQRAASCQEPSISTADKSLEADAAADMIIAALVCGLTKVVSLSMATWGSVPGENGSSFHGISHWEYGKEPGTAVVGPWGPDYLVTTPGSSREAEYRRMYGWVADKVGRLMSKMDAVQEANGRTLLDDTIVYWGNELGGGSAHDDFGAPVLIGGTAHGKFIPGYWDFTHRPHLLYANRLDNRQPAGTVPYANFLTTLLRALGIGRDEYEPINGQPGWGHVNLPHYQLTAYPDGPGGSQVTYQADSIYGAYLGSDANRRRAVAHWYIGE